jgi:hypothetical protein
LLFRYKLKKIDVRIHNLFVTIETFSLRQTSDRKRQMFNRILKTMLAYMLLTFP